MFSGESSERDDLHSSVVPANRIEGKILLIRGEKVILDAHLAALYGVTTRRLNEQVRRNRHRFPADFMFQLTDEERLQAVANCDLLSNIKYSNVLPHAFTEHGAIMAASVLNTPRAVEMSVFVVRAIKRLMAPPGRPDAPAPPDKRRIGFHAEDGGSEE